MTVVVWIKREIVLNWEHYKDNPQEIYDICTREPGDLDFMQVNISHEEYKRILINSPLWEE